MFTNNSPTASKMLYSPQIRHRCAGRNKCVTAERDARISSNTAIKDGILLERRIELITGDTPTRTDNPSRIQHCDSSWFHGSRFGPSYPPQTQSYCIQSIKIYIKHVHFLLESFKLNYHVVGFLHCEWDVCTDSIMVVKLLRLAMGAFESLCRDIDEPPVERRLRSRLVSLINRGKK
jgi:hypothetical protein